MIVVPRLCMRYEDASSAGNNTGSKDQERNDYQDETIIIFPQEEGGGTINNLVSVQPKEMKDKIQTYGSRDVLVLDRIEVLKYYLIVVIYMIILHARLLKSRFHIMNDRTPFIITS